MQEASLKLTKKWADEVKKSLKDNPDQKERFSTVSDLEIKRLYTPEDIKDTNFAKISACRENFLICAAIRRQAIVVVTGHFACFPAWAARRIPTNAGIMLLSQGQTGLSTAFDFPTLMGYDSDSPKALGEVGKCGVAIDTLEDFLALMKDIPLDQGYHFHDHQSSGNYPLGNVLRGCRNQRHTANQNRRHYSK
jgi:methylmalonyl-CoA mutase N-terminal domain/subunit